MIRQAAAFLHSNSGRYVLLLQILFSMCHLIKLIFLLKMNLLDDVVVGSSHNREHLRPNAKTLRTANGYSAEPRGRGIFPQRMFKILDATERGDQWLSIYVKLSSIITTRTLCDSPPDFVIIFFLVSLNPASWSDEIRRAAHVMPAHCGTR